MASASPPIWTDRAAVGGLVALADDAADRALAPDGGGLDLAPVAGDDQQRDHGPVAREVGGETSSPGSNSTLAAGQGDGLQVRLQDLEIAGAERGQQAVGVTGDGSRIGRARRGGDSPVHGRRHPNGFDPTGTRDSRACCVGRLTQRA